MKLSGAKNTAAQIELNPVNGNLVLNGAIFNDNSKPYFVYGANGKTLTVNTVLGVGNTAANVSFNIAQNSNVVFTANQIYAGITVISAGSLQVGNGGTSGALGIGAVSNNSSLIFNRSDSVTVANTINGTGTVKQAGSGATKLSGNNGFTGATTVDAGTMEAGGEGALGATSGITVNTGGTLLLSGPGNRINNGAGLTLAGGAFKTGGTTGEGNASTVGVGNLTLVANSTLDFGTGGVASLMFTCGSFSGGILSILNWSGAALTAGTDGLNDRLMIEGDSAERLAFLSAFSQASVSFSGFGSGYSAVQFDANHFEIVPVPEPSAVLAAFTMVGLAGWRERRRFRTNLRAQRCVAVC